MKYGTVMFISRGIGVSAVLPARRTILTQSNRHLTQTLRNHDTNLYHSIVFPSSYLFPLLVSSAHTPYSSQQQHGNCPKMLRQFRRGTQFGGMGLGGINSIGLFYSSEGTERVPCYLGRRMGAEGRQERKIKEYR